MKGSCPNTKFQIVELSTQLSVTFYRNLVITHSIKISCDRERSETPVLKALLQLKYIKLQIKVIKSSIKVMYALVHR